MNRYCKERRTSPIDAHNKLQMIDHSTKQIPRDDARPTKQSLADLVATVDANSHLR